MGRRSRKRRPQGAAAPVPAAQRAAGRAAAEPSPASATASAPAAPEPVDRAARIEAKNAAARASLEPLGDGERPGAIVAAAAVALLLGLGNLAAYLAGLEVNGRKPAFTGVAGFSGLMIVAAVGMFRLKYWAVLGFQALLALILLVFFLLLLRASSLRGLLVTLVALGVAGVLFYKLIRAMARIQMPERPGR
jgi:hypothetical protein